LEQLEPPMFTVGKSDAILQVLPTALRFWGKLGLGPRGGKKNVTVFALFEENGEERQQQVERWLNNMSATYTVSKFRAVWLSASDNISGPTLGCAYCRELQQLPKGWHCPSKV
jgi:hypothetical protein